MAQTRMLGFNTYHADDQVMQHMNNVGMSNGQGRSVDGMFTEALNKIDIFDDTSDDFIELALLFANDFLEEPNEAVQNIHPHGYQRKDNLSASTCYVKPKLQFPTQSRPIQVNQQRMDDYNMEDTLCFSNVNPRKRRLEPARSLDSTISNFSTSTLAMMEDVTPMSEVKWELGELDVANGETETKNFDEAARVKRKPYKRTKTGGRRKQKDILPMVDEKKQFQTYKDLFAKQLADEKFEVLSESSEISSSTVEEHQSHNEHDIEMNDAAEAADSARAKWGPEDAKLLWEGILTFGNEWRAIRKLFPSRSYDQVKDKGRRMLRQRQWKTGRTKFAVDDAATRAKIIARFVLFPHENDIQNMSRESSDKEAKIQNATSKRAGF